MRPPPRPLPLAPRPLPRESVRSWVARLGARYGLSASEFLAWLNARRGVEYTRAAWLNWATDAELDRSLAIATRLSEARIRVMRVAGGRSARETSQWAREHLTWCPQCVHDDVARHGESYERIAWRLGCCVTCTVHGRLLAESCPVCRYPACTFGAKDGRLRLVCGLCARAIDTVPDLSEAPHRVVPGPSWLGVPLSPELIFLSTALQTDLLAALAGSTLKGPWAPSVSVARFARTVRELGAALLDPFWLPPESPRRKAILRGGLSMAPVRVGIDVLWFVAVALTEVVNGVSAKAGSPPDAGDGPGAGPVGFLTLAQSLGEDDLEAWRAGMPAWDPVIADAARTAATIVLAARQRTREEGLRRIAERRRLTRNGVRTQRLEALRAAARRRIAARARRRAKLVKVRLAAASGVRTEETVRRQVKEASSRSRDPHSRPCGEPGHFYGD